MKKILLVVLAIVSLTSLVACSGEKSKSYDIDINQCVSDLKEGLSLTPDYTFVTDYDIIEKDNNLTISIVVEDYTDPDKALDFADTVVRQLNHYAQLQDSSIESSSADNYGGLYKEYTTLVGVSPQSKISEQNEWFVYGSIGNGNVKLKLNKNYQ